MHSALAVTTETQRNPARRLQIRQVMSPPAQYTSEILRLMVLDGDDDQTYQMLGIEREDAAAQACSRITASGGSLFVADAGGRLSGMLHLVPSLRASASLGHHVWNIEHLLLEPNAPDGAVEALLGYALAFLRSRVDFLSVRVSASNGPVIRGLHLSGFRVVAGEALGVLTGPVASAWQLPGVTFEPLEPELVEPAAQMARECRDCHPYRHDHGFQPEKIGSFFQGVLTGYMKNSNQSAIAALGRARELLGFVAFSKNHDFLGQNPRGGASLDHLCVSSHAQSKGLEELLWRMAVRSLGKEGFHAITARTIINSPGSLQRLAVMRKIGFEITTSSLVMHCWLKDCMDRVA